MHVASLSQAHRDQLTLAVSRALGQWLPAVDAPDEIVQGLERVLLFLRQNGSPSKQARQVASLAFCWGDQLVRSGKFTWQSVSEDASVNPSIVSEDGRWACLVVDLMTAFVIDQQPATLTGLYRAMLAGEAPPKLSGIFELRESVAMSTAHESN